MSQYDRAVQAYKAIGVDTEKAIATLNTLPISIHCWQADDVGGFESPDAILSGGGIQVTGNFPGKARSIEEVQKDLEKVLSLVPGTHRLNLHASYGDFGGKKVDRDEIEPHHFDVWIQWAKKHNLNIDFNGTFFSHPLAEEGYTLSSKNKEIRDFWIRHAKKTRDIAAYIGKEMGSPCILNTWIPDGAKDVTFDRMGYRKILKDSLDEIFETEYPNEYMRDAVETKLFGIGSETFVVGSHEFYMNYASRNNKMLCIDMGHFHVDEDVSDKLSSILLFDDEMLLHISRPVHWDSDHVVTLNDKVKNVARELVRSGKLENVHIGLDFFDASINRIGAYVTGIRSFQKALLTALLEPISSLQQLESEGKGFEKLATFEALSSLPFGAVYEELLSRNKKVDDFKAITEISDYETEVLSRRV
ncbi:MAG: L-rhamnose isomerase [Bacteroidales bacterium]|jgi:L-rhamnose isomerase|nr:L-rhamnose isomerase [Bacteroidales bacterium]